MLMQCEKTLVHKGYLPTNETDKLLSYHKKRHPFKEFNVELINQKYKISFPIGDDQYTTTIKKREDMVNYIQYILNENVL